MTEGEKITFMSVHFVILQLSQVALMQGKIETNGEAKAFKRPGDFSVLPLYPSYSKKWNILCHVHIKLSRGLYNRK